MITMTVLPDDPIYKTSSHHNKHWKEGSANISRDGQYRFALSRSWASPDQEKIEVLFIMLNPSTADHEKDDATIRRCIGFAKSWGATGMMVGNLYSRICTNPDEMFAMDEIESADAERKNAMFLNLMKLKADIIVYAWGAFFDKEDAADTFMECFPGGYHIGEYTKKGCPRHPLYLNKNLPLIDEEGRVFYNIQVIKNLE